MGSLVSTLQALSRRPAWFWGAFASFVAMMGIITQINAPAVREAKAKLGTGGVPDGSFGMSVSEWAQLLKVSAYPCGSHQFCRYTVNRVDIAM